MTESAASFDEALTAEFKRLFDEAMTDTDIEDPRAAASFAADEAFAELMDRLTDIHARVRR